MKKKHTILLLSILLCLSLFALPVSANEIEVDVAETPVTQISETAETTVDTRQTTPAPSETPEQVQTAESAPITLAEKEPAIIYPTDIRYDSLGTKRYIHKTYKLPENISIDSIIDLPYKEDGYNWKSTEVILKETIVNSETKEVAESVELVTDTDNMGKILAQLEPTLEYDQDGYAGTLELDEGSIQITADGVSTYSFAVTEVREYPNLASNDMASVPKTIQVGGQSFSLGNVSWKPTDTTGSSGYSDYITGYTAVASYTGTATGSKTDGYLVTAAYKGSVTKPAVNTNIYTIVYEGAPIPPIPIPSPPYLLFGLGVLLLIVAVVMFFRLKSNTKIYILEHGVPKLHHRTRISPSNPVVNIEGLEECRLRIVLTKSIVNSLPERKIYLESDRNNYAVKLGNKLVVQYPPFEKPVLEVSASSPYRYTQPQSVPMMDYPTDAIKLESDSEDAPEIEPNPLREMLPNIWQEEFGGNLPKNAFNASDLREDELESDDQVFRVFWKGKGEENETEN